TNASLRHRPWYERPASRTIAAGMSLSPARASEMPCLRMLRASLSGSKATLTMFLYPQKPPVSTIQDEQTIQGHSTDGCEHCNPCNIPACIGLLADRSASQYGTDSRTAAGPDCVQLIKGLDRDADAG